ncbi:putative ADP-ribosylation factor GTPase-activating protein AGD5 [Heracleum sosnowskyi]|uniref:ADP-ribosylation factor GTPase-activating protein AGD5 n=1 Tax=Heracleum sosnowskyi TaxID=360622 RepID=A0AAD8I5C0_9APIA|nr:putative ADP-ribosylation factor GTPase-activating protein AGD5 [Heracleum sosnowskyi]
MNEKARISKELNAKHQKILEGLLRLPENRECADCKSIAPRWASVNLGIFICMRCSGIHRSLGVHISKVRSATLDTWLPDQIAMIQSMGNAKSNSYWESELPPNYDRVGIENFIRAKYIDKRWISRGVKVTPSSTVREEKLLVNREVTSNTSDKEHVNSFPKSSDERKGSQLHNSNSKLLSSNGRNHVPQKVSKLVNNEHQISESQGLENGLDQRKSNLVAVVSPSKRDHDTDLFTLLPVNNSEENGQKVVPPGDNMKMEIQLYEAAPKTEETVISKESESKIQVANGFEDLFQGLQWVPMPVSQESPKELQTEKPGVLSQLPTDHAQLATQSRQQHFPMAIAAKTHRVPQAAPGIINQLNFSNGHKPAQSWGNTVKPVPPKTMQVPDQPKLVQIGHVQPSYHVGNSPSYTKSRSISGMHSDKFSRMQRSEGSASPTIRRQTASTRSPIIPTQLGGDYDFSSLVQGMFDKFRQSFCTPTGCFYHQLISVCSIY